MTLRPHILITNDDGIHAPGIRHLWNALHEFADVTIVAPETEQSAVGLSITIRSPLRIDKVRWPNDTAAWAVNGTPADCVKLALNVIMERKPDLVVSGINRGSNAGRNLFYSGTVAGVIEGVMHNIPGVALSCRDYVNTDYNIAEKYVPHIIKHAIQHPLPHGTFLNVNFPSTSHQTIQGFKMARQGMEYWCENPDKRSHPAEGHSYYWLGAKLAEFDEHEESDIVWLKKGFVTGVPVQVHELTNIQELHSRREHFENIQL